ncbi:MAG: O-antigen ligase family protein [Candidatus Taylorbacteria bacterium]|nr:O-antigen ligase family protein [Candidatus Taylorbacteria bacterium]
MNANKILRVSILIGIFLLPFIPLFVSNHLFFPFITGKNFAFRIIVELITGLWLILALRDRTALPKSSRLLQAFAVFIAVLFISDLLSPNVYKSFWSNYERMEGWVTLAHLFALFVVLCSVMTKKLWEWLFRVSIGVSFILFIYSALQLAGKLDIHQGASRVDATIGNSAYLGGYMLFHIFLALYLLFVYVRQNYGTRAWGLFWPIVYGLAVPADVFILFKTATRGAEIGLVAGLVCFAAGLVFFERQNEILRRTGAGLLIIVALLGGLFVLERRSDFVVHNESLSRLGSFADQLLTFDKKAICEGELKSRCLLWPMSFQGVKERPIFGWGQESFNYVFNKYYDPRMFSQEQWFDRTHNVFFDWLIAGGILGLLSYLSLFGFALYYLWKKGGAFSTLESSLLTGLLVGYFFHNFTVFDNITSYILFVMVLSYISSAGGNVSAGLEQKIKTLDAGLKNRLIIPLIAVATVFAVYKVNVPAILAASELIQALSGQAGGPAVNLEHYKKAFAYGALGDSEIREQLVQTTSQAAGNPNVDPKMRSDFFELARSQMAIQLQRTPEDARYFLFAGTFLASFGDFDNAIKALTKARELSPNKQTIIFSLGSAYLGKQDFKSAVLVFKQAFDLAPSFDDARRAYALALVYDKQLKAAEEILQPLNLESVLNDQRLIIAYFSSGFYGKALESLNFLIKKEPNNPQYYLSRAAVEAALGNRSAAIADLNKAAAINPAAKAQVDKYIEQVKAGQSI